MLLEACHLSGFTGSWIERNFPRNESTLSLTHNRIRWYLDTIFDLELMLKWVKTLSSVRMKYILQVRGHGFLYRSEVGLL